MNRTKSFIVIATILLISSLFIVGWAPADQCYIRPSCMNTTPSNATSRGTIYASTCVAGQFIQGYDSSGIASCGIPAGGGVTRRFVSLDRTGDLGTINNTIWQPTGLNFSVVANTNYTYQCNLIAYTNVATTGVQFNVTVPNNPTRLTAGFEQPTTTTAPLYSTCAGTANSCLSSATASVVTPGVPVTINGRLLNGANAGNWSLWIKSEIISSLVNLSRGSHCVMFTE